MQIVFLRDNLHESLSLFSGTNKKTIINLSSAEFAQGVVKMIKTHVFVNCDEFVIFTYGEWMLNWLLFL